MDKLIISNEWDEIKNRLKKKYGHLMCTDYTEEELHSRMQKKIGKTHDDIRKLIAKL